MQAEDLDDLMLNQQPVLASSCVAQFRVPGDHVGRAIPCPVGTQAQDGVQGAPSIPVLLSLSPGLHSDH